MECGQKSYHKGSVFSVGLPTRRGQMLPQEGKTPLDILVSSEKVGNIDCYKIRETKNTTVWVEKATGIIIKKVSAENVTNTTYEIGTVTDADIQKPDLTGYSEG